MRRMFIAAATTATALATLSGLPAQADDPSAPRPLAPQDPALTVAARVMDGRPGVGDPDPTLALRDLRLAMPRLSAADRTKARSLLARPTDGPADTQGDGYNSPSSKKCNTHFCLHYVTNAVDPDAPPAGWVDETLKQLDKVWKLEIGQMGYRKPLSDGTKGGNTKLDIYLKDVGPKFYYGYCAPEKRHPTLPYLYSGYCVLDDDFDPAQYGGAPALNSLKVTAAHEFFHASQFATDVSEDRWFMESTATWMEERFADNVDDNRQYLPAGQIGRPQISLDTFASADLMQYGNWLWWEYLTSRYGNGLVKQVWNKAGAFKGAPDQYSTQALASVLKSKGGFKKAFGAYASGNTLPAETYPEGAAYTPAPVTGYTLESSAKSTGTRNVNINHMASRSIRLTPGGSLTGGNWALRVTIDAPDSTSSPVVNVLTVKLDGSVKRETIALSKSGAGKDTFSFNPSGVSSVTVTLSNASTRFACWRGSDFSCQGNARDDGKAFKYTAAAFQQ